MGLKYRVICEMRHNTMRQDNDETKEYSNKNNYALANIRTYIFSLKVFPKGLLGWYELCKHLENPASMILFSYVVMFPRISTIVSSWRTFSFCPS